MKRYSLFAVAAAVVTAALPVGSAAAHEYWIAPLAYQVDAGEPVSADLRVGQVFKGGARSFLPARFFSFKVTNGDSEAPVEGRIGDRPAMRDAALAPGLNIITQETKPEKLTWAEFAKFESFVAMHGLDHLVDRHRERGLKEEGFVERYRRHAKSLVQVGEAAGSDRAVGMTYELVAEANPYALDGNALPVRLYWESEPEAGTQIHVFREGGDAILARVVTDDQGRALIPVQPGETYLVNAVHMEERGGAAAEDHAVWESFWASLTFAIPQ